MRMWKAISVLAMVLSVVNIAWLAARDREPANFLSPEDYLEIQQLYAYYARDVDSGSQRDASWMYTDDGVWDVEGMKWVGREQLKQHYTTMPPGVSKNGIRHFSTNLILVPTENGVRGSAYMVALERKTEGGPIEITLMGKYEDLLVKTDRGWRFKERVFRMDTHYDDLTPVLPSPYIPVDG